MLKWRRSKVLEEEEDNSGVSCSICKGKISEVNTVLKAYNL